MIARFFFFVFLLIILALAIMFDWFGMRELTHNGIEHFQNIVFKLSEAGYWLTNSTETVKKTIDSASGQ